MNIGFIIIYKRVLIVLMSIYMIEVDYMLYSMYHHIVAIITRVYL